jgi:signal transduction histidine kinase
MPLTSTAPSLAGTAGPLARWRFWVLIGVPSALLMLALMLVARWYLVASQSSAFQPLPQPSYWVETLEGVSYDTAGFAQLAHRPMALSKAHWQPMPMPHFMRLPVRADLRGNAVSRLWIRAQVPSDAVDQANGTLALYMVRAVGGALSLWVNDELVFVNLDEWRMQWNRPLLVSVPRHLLRPGKPVTIHLALPYLAAQGFSVGSIYVGSSMALQPTYDLRMFVQHTLPQVGMIVMVIMGMLSLQFWTVRRGETEHLLMGAACVAWVVCNLQYFFDFDNDLWASAWFGTVVDSAVAWVMLLLVIFALKFQSRSFRTVELVLMTYVLGMTAVTLPLWGWRANALSLQHSMDVAMACFVCPFLTWRAWAEKRSELWALGLSAWAMLIFGAFDTFGLTSQVNPDGIYLFPYATILVFMALMYATQKRHLMALKTSDEMTTSLQGELDFHRGQYAQELTCLSQAELQHLRQVERERLRLDLHGHLNHSILAALHKVQAGPCPAKELADELRQCFDETRLVIESLEPVEHDVEILLGSMRLRLESQLKQRGVTLIWRLGLVQSLPWLEAPQCLQVLRMVSMAVQSVLEGDTVNTITLLTEDRPSGVLITLRGAPVPPLLGAASPEPGSHVSGEAIEGIRRLVVTLGGRTGLVHEPDACRCVWIELPLQASLNNL